MTWFYSQSAGTLHLNDDLVGTGYSGFGEGLDNPADQEIPDVGPIPQGFYLMGVAFPHPVTGPLTMRLEPTQGTDTFGRSGFLMHGDNANQDHSASHGCIIMEHDVRLLVAVNSDRLLQVVE